MHTFLAQPPCSCFQPKSSPLQPLCSSLLAIYTPSSPLLILPASRFPLRPCCSPLKHIRRGEALQARDDRQVGERKVLRIKRTAVVLMCPCCYSADTQRLLGHGLEF